jgi:hypothetical protein
MVGIIGNILPWIDHILFKVLRSRPKINLSMLIKKKKKKGWGLRWRGEGLEWKGVREGKEEGRCGLVKRRKRTRKERVKVKR